MGELDIHLSFIIVTRNRLDFLKITLTRLIQNLKTGEEIVVVDGNSNDGSKEYLLDLFNAGKIHQFISEPDQNQAHGWNKAMLMAKGKIIKKIIDDDVFDYSTIRRCAEYMLVNPTVNIIISNELNASLSNHNQISKSTRLIQFMAWKEQKTESFTFSDVHILIRKSVLPYIGLYNTSFVMMDWEYALRISFLKTKIVYFTGYNALSVGHEESISANKNAKLVYQQGERARLIYNYAGDDREITLWSKLKIKIGKILYAKSNTEKYPAHKINISEVYADFYLKIEEINNQNEGKFIA
ncbi:glycosyltransferase [Pedobacter miscanthi]|uniref:glycosyltransferase n=1 Tax=Pedobacter miscanthi TaxID=2259170 RepID=UPI00292F3CAD|nr:glycosyltransferase [Pedobacter miscanthi]